MNFLNVFSMKRLAVMLVLPAFLLAATTGCDDDGEVVIPVEDGTYMSGTATGEDGLSNNFAMFQGRVEGDGFSSNLRTGMFEGFGYLVAGQLNIVIKAGETETSYGLSGTESTLTLNGENSQIVGSVKTGTIADGAGPITIASAGFYHVIMDMETETYHYYKIEDFEFTNGFQTLPKVSADASGARWSEDDIRIEGNFKFRWNEGWKVIVEDGATFADDYIIFSNFGKGATADVSIAGGGEWAVADLPGGDGLYTVTVDWNPGEGWELTFTRTGDIPAQDLSGESLEIIGLGAIYSGSAVGWDSGAQGQLPTQTGSLYKWTYTGVSFDPANGFKFRTTGSWSGTFNIGCDFATYDGPDAADLTCEGGAGSNLKGLVASADYTIVVTIDGNDVAGGKTLTVTAE